MSHLHSWHARVPERTEPRLGATISGAARSCLMAALASWAVGAGTAAWAQPMPAGDDHGYSFVLGLGRLQQRYQEYPGSQPVRSAVRTSSPMIASGALYTVNRELMFSLDNEVTVFPDTATETWTATSGTFNGVALTDRVLQTNQASFSHSDTRLFGHYRLAGPGFVLGGATVRSQSFKRHSFEQGADRAVALPDAKTVEETSSEVLLNLGAAVESGGVRGRDSHYSARALVGVPVVRRVENTSQPGVRFDGTGGWDLSLEGRYSLAVHEGVHLGLWGRWSTVHRSSQSQRSGGTTFELPRYEQSLLAYGVELLWKL